MWSIIVSTPLVFVKKTSTPFEIFISPIFVGVHPARLAAPWPPAEPSPGRLTALTNDQ